MVLVGWLAVMAWRRYRHDTRLFRGSMVAAVLVVAQAALGAVVVKGDLKASLVTAHFATAMLLAGTLVYVVASSFCNVLIEERGTARVGHEPGYARLAVATASVYGTSRACSSSRYSEPQNRREASGDVLHPIASSLENSPDTTCMVSRIVAGSTSNPWSLNTIDSSSGNEG